MYTWRDANSPGGSLSPLWMNPVDKSIFTISDMSKIFINLINDYQASNRLDTNIQIGPHNTRVRELFCINHGVDLIYFAKVINVSSPTIMKKT